MSSLGASSSPESVRVLIVDDDPTSRRLLSAVLVHEGFEVSTACDGSSAMRSINESPPHVVVLDYEMPDLTGAQVCQQIRSDPRPAIRDIPVLMLTAHSSDEDEVDCLQAGANDFVSKPVGRAVLAARIRTQLRLQALSDELRNHNEELARWRASQVADLEAARTTQMAIVPQTPPDFPGWKVEACYAPMIQVGGDLYGWRRRDDEKCIFWLVDATGHGVAAALLTTLTALLFQQASAETDSPGRILASVNNEFCTVFRGRSYMTACCLTITPSGLVEYSSAGHPPLLVRRATGTVESVGAHATVLGIRKTEPIEQTRLQLAPGDSALIYTDGLYSLTHLDGSHFRGNELATAWSEMSSVVPAIPGLMERMLALATEAQFDDDVAALCLHRRAS